MAFLTPARLRRILGSVLTLVVCAATAGGAASQDRSGEDAIKAAFLYNFTKYVDWPATVFDGQTGTFRVCVAADASFAGVIEGMMKGETVRGRPVEVIRLERDANPRVCHLAYFSGQDAERTARLLPAVRQQPVLTVGEGLGFLDQGGLISFALENNKVRFDVNKRGADQSGLRVSSKLLGVARSVQGSQP
jgi:hypothetical protein